jgi:hypothetical protein
MIGPASDAVGLAFLRCGGASNIEVRRVVSLIAELKIERVYRPCLTATEAMIGLDRESTVTPQRSSPLTFIRILLYFYVG